MSTFLSDKSNIPLKTEEDLAGYFQAFAKPREAMAVGVEVEVLGVIRETGKALAYHGELGVHTILKALAEKFQYEPVFEKENIIALRRFDSTITLEPGGQVELSAPPATNVFEIQEQVTRFLDELRQIRAIYPAIDWLATGIQPFSPLDEIEWVPKERYHFMAEYLKCRGTQSHEMMKRTATNQVNVDYLDEEDAMDSLKVVLGLTSIVSALFSNSCFSDGRPNGFLSKRLDIWNHTDPARTGLLIEFTHEGRRFQDYLNYLLDMPMLFLVRNGQWIKIENLTFRQFLHAGYQGLQPTLADFELHLSSAFPEARLKQYLEIRGVDCQPPELIASVAAFWKGLLYCQEARDAAWELVGFVSDAERLELHQAVAKQGLNARLRHLSIRSLAEELVELSCQSLARQTTRDEKRDECRFLQTIREKIIRSSKSPAESFLAWYQAANPGKPVEVIDYLSIQ
ncbi:MAG: hypothetical protein H6757_06995 [Candidatus Omnitrophica bacterium]|nr:hypothetical protein [Candidatus Omnitrophota bacterium]